jgi:protein SCO1
VGTAVAATAGIDFADRGCRERDNAKCVTAGEIAVSRLGTMTILVAVVIAALAVPAQANFTSAQLTSIAASPPADGALPLDLTFRDEYGRSTTIGRAIGGVPALVIFADYTCHTLCGPIVEFAAAGLAKTGLKPGVEYRLLVIGLDPKDGLDTARAMRAAHIPPNNPVGDGTEFLSGTDTDIHTAATALGLHYAYDAEHDQYAHPAAAYVLDKDGRVRRLLSPLGLNGSDLRLALVDAGNGGIGRLADRIHLLCYGYDPVRGIYTERVTTMLGYAAGATLVVMLTGLFAMAAYARRRTTS